MMPPHRSHVVPVSMFAKRAAAVWRTFPAARESPSCCPGGLPPPYSIALADTACTWPDYTSVRDWAGNATLVVGYPPATEPCQPPPGYVAGAATAVPAEQRRARHAGGAGGLPLGSVHPRGGRRPTLPRGSFRRAGPAGGASQTGAHAVAALGTLLRKATIDNARAPQLGGTISQADGSVQALVAALIAALSETDGGMAAERQAVAATYAALERKAHDPVARQVIRDAAALRDREFVARVAAAIPISTLWCRSRRATPCSRSAPRISRRRRRRDRFAQRRIGYCARDGAAAGPPRRRPGWHRLPIDAAIRSPAEGRRAVVLNSSPVMRSLNDDGSSRYGWPSCWRAPAEAGLQPDSRLPARARTYPREAPADLRLAARWPPGLMGYNVTPDGSANAITVNRRSGSPGGGEAAPTLTLGQFGFGFTVSKSFPLFLESYIGYARYDPRTLFTGATARQLPLRWNNVAATIGVGWDIRLTDYLVLRPILNGSVGYAASDAALFGTFVRPAHRRRSLDARDLHVHVAGLGGSLMLAYYDHRPARDIDVELRYTQIRLETFGDTVQAAYGSATAQTLGLWGRYRWPTRWEAFGRPIRWVLDGSATTYLGDQREALGFAWAMKLGGGIEFDVGRFEVGAAGINLSLARLIGRYFVGDRGVTGISFGIGLSF